jgi:hypothetical protein
MNMYASWQHLGMHILFLGLLLPTFSLAWTTTVFWLES